MSSQEVGADVEVRAGVRPRTLHRIQQIFSNFYLESESVKSGIFGELKSSLTSYPASRFCALNHTCLEMVPTEEKAAAALKVVKHCKTGGD
ncbi:60S ribosomal protein L6 [Culex quinquefasciatus]|uniref:60S ribosomal protein L6 n=1 Tax=Culex quinquefasciatus TaxID=7176 RepID=B0XKV8_CULQU|nr:60S ribosomal protein L6 [Culex quinquefasciatus]|eukprot:XP_001870280.1 60S ribosomal protein L6 [Culex quinquefasciatus]